MSHSSVFYNVLTSEFCGRVAGVLTTFPAAVAPAIGDPFTGLTAGSVLFGGVAGVLAQDNAHLFFNTTTKGFTLGGALTAEAASTLPGYLGIGPSVGFTGLWMTTAARSFQNYTVMGDTTGNTYLNAKAATTISLRIGNATILDITSAGLALASGKLLTGVGLMTVGGLATTGTGALATRYLTDLSNAIAFLDTGVDSTHAWQIENRFASAAKVLLTVKGASGQTASLMQWVNTTGAILARVEPDGAFLLGDGAAPTMPTNTAGLFGDDVGGTVNLFAIDEAGVTTRLTWPGEVTLTATGNQDDLAFGDAQVVRFNNATDVTVRGLVAGRPGQRVTITSVGAGHVFVAHQHASSAAANRIINAVTSGVTPLAAGVGSATFVYDDTTDRWRLVAHQQGAYITPPFDAAHFFGEGAMTWTLTGADVLTCAYYLAGRAITLAFWLDNTSVGGTLSDALKYTLPNSYTIAKRGLHTYIYSDGGGANSTDGRIQVVESQAVVQFYTAGGANWGAATNSTKLYGTLSFEVN